MLRQIATASFCFLLVCQSARTEETDPNRLAGEAAALFRVVMSEERAPTRCGYDPQWLDMPIPENVAQKYFGLTLHAALSPTEDAASIDPKGAIDPGGKHPNIFCDRAQAEEYGRAQFAAFEKDKSAMRIYVNRTSFTAPVFDAEYGKAAVVVEHTGIGEERLDSSLSRFKKGDIMHHPGEVADVVKVYVKWKDGWRLFGSELIGQS